MLRSLLRRYGIKGIALNVLLKVAGKLLGLEHLQIHRMLVADLREAGKAAWESSWKFQELRFADFERCAANDPERFTPAYMERLRKRFGKSGYLCYGCIEWEVVAGYGWISLDVLPRTDEDVAPSDGCLFDDYTNAAFRGRGLHRQLISYRMWQLSRQGKTRALAFVDIYNRASLRGFRACGFTQCQLFAKWQKDGKEFSRMKYGKR